MRQEIVEKTATFPTEPGVYIFTGRGGKTLYVGKATNLRSRVRSYLRPGGDGRVSLRFLEQEAEDVEFLVTRTEQEALLLEDTIVKKRKPTYNVKLRDDKAFLMLRLDRSEAWPWFRLVRRRRDDGADYFGPYASAKSVRRTLRLLHKVVPLRDCSDGVFRNRSRPCLKHQIGRCPAPCVGLIDREDYDVLLDEATAVLRGSAGSVLRRLRNDMDAAARALEFERAQAIKLQIEALEAVAERQSVVGSAVRDEDVVGMHRTAEQVTAVFLLFRGGRLESSRRFTVPTALPDELLLGDLVTRFYQGDRFVPSTVVVPAPIAEQGLIEDWLAEKRGANVELVVPRRGDRRAHLDMAMENARASEAALADEVGRRLSAAARLAEFIGMDDPPQRIHCLDVSTTQGRGTVASRVSFVDGRPDKNGYRRFRISAENAGDDFSALGEAVRRSLTRCLEDARDELPDLMILDGGRGQLGAALDAMAELGLGDTDLAVVGLAKSRLRGVGDDQQRTAERLFLPGRSVPVFLPDNAPPTLLVAAARDEAHRFAITYHRKVRGALTSALDEIEGVGPSRRRLLLRYFGSVDAVRKAALDDLRAVPGLPSGVAERVFRGLRGDGDPAADAGGPERSPDPS